MRNPFRLLNKNRGKVVDQAGSSRTGCRLVVIADHRELVYSLRFMQMSIILCVDVVWFRVRSAPEDAEELEMLLKKK